MGGARQLYSIVFICILFGPVSATGVENGFISFESSSLLAQEGDGGNTPVILALVRSGGTAGSVTVFTQVVNITSDFTTTEQSATFFDGQTREDLVYFIRSDTLAEGNETFVIEIVAVNGGAEIGPQANLRLTIEANDDPFGVVTFAASTRSISALEPVNGTRTVELTVQRGPGVYGNIPVDWEISGASTDISPTSGELVFGNGIGQVTLQLFIQADDIPENDEAYTVRLTRAGGGAVLGQQNETAALVTIPANDSPIRFSSSMVRVDEGVGASSVSVTRGLLADGSTVGPLSDEVTVMYEVVAGSATSGVDYSGMTTGSVTFTSSITSQSIQFTIVDDVEPEGDETFTIRLFMPSSDAVLLSPSEVTVVITVNDDAGGVVEFASTDPVTVQEDGSSPSTTFTIQRDTGTVSDLTVSWSVVDSRGQLASDDFSPPNNTISLPHGVNSANLTITLTNDTSPEPPEVFSVRLDEVTSGAGRLGGALVVMVTVTDSDDAYGRLEWAENNRLQVSADPRQLSVVILRFGGLLGSISVSYRILYLPPGVTDPSNGVADTTSPSSGSVRMEFGDGSAALTVNISSEAVLEPQSHFYIELTDVVLNENNPILSNEALSSPRIGPRSAVLVDIPPAVSNGLIGFNQLSYSVEEPEDGDSTAIILDISRSGSFGQATVIFSVTAVSSSFNVLQEVDRTSGVVTIADGSMGTSLVINVLSDTDPELDEMFQIQLVSVSESNQALSPQSSNATITVLRNDNPEGTFLFPNASLGPHIIQENVNDPVNLTIQRVGGALTSERILHQAAPSNQRDLLGGNGVVNFAAGERWKSFTVAARSDGIPELDETFEIELFNEDGSRTNIGSPSTVNITVLENEDPNGVFSFLPSSTNISIDEVPNGGSSNSIAYTARFTVQREAGLFGQVTVTWYASGSTSPDLDLTSTSGELIFQEDETSAILEIGTVDDMISETEEMFTITLSNITGGGRLASSNIQARLTINQNDDSVLVQNNAVNTLEGSTLVLYITRGGRANGESEVSFTVETGTAGTGDFNVTTSSPVVFVDGQTRAEVVIEIVNDDIPESEEEFQLMLTNVTGDAVLVRPNTTTVLIAANDDHQGVFSFAASSLTLTAEEGMEYSLVVMREGGLFERISVVWEVTAVTESNPSSNTDFMATSGQITFEEETASGNLTLSVLADGVPELEEMFRVSLTRTVSGGRLNNLDTSSEVTILANEFPHGLIQFVSSSRLLDVAEDIPSGNQTADTATLTIERTMGNFGNITVLWEAFKEGGGVSSPLVDLLLQGEYSGGVVSVAPRPTTDTIALQFDGNSNVAVPSTDQLLPGDVNDGFTISLWLRPNLASDGGYLIAKVLNGELLYGLELRTLFAAVFLFQPATVGSGQVTASTAISSAILLDGNLHHLATVINSTNVLFYLDGSLLESISVQEELNDQPGGIVYVGGWQNDDFEGVLQDVRMYSDPLSSSEVSILAADDVAADITPISGYLSLEEDVMSATFNVTSVDDGIAEPAERFTISLVAASGGAEVKSNGTAESVLTVLKSDFSNGLFRFGEPLSNGTSQEGTAWGVRVVRGEGLNGHVTVTWEVTMPDNNSTPATADFEQDRGQIQFEPMEMEKLLYLNITDDTQPELSEDFVVSLVGVAVSGSQKETTATSGAGIDGSASETSLMVEESDDPYGLIQFWTMTPPPMPGDRTTPPLTVQPVLTVEEEIRVAMVTVVRAQGLVGSVSVEYQTVDGSALNGVDYISAAGTVTFSGDERSKTITVDIIDNLAPELEKYFTVELNNPGGVPEPPSLGIGRRITVSVLPSDDAYGVFSFTDDSVSVLAQEHRTVLLTVQRVGGLLGNVTVYWEAHGNYSMDVNPSAGEVTFLEEASLEIISITIVNDTFPEFAEPVVISLTSVSNGALSSTNRDATVTVEASDDPYGSFVFAASSRPVRVEEDEENVTLTIIREFGQTGRVEVFYQTLDPSNLPQSIRNTITRNESIASPSDFQSVESASVVFEDGESFKHIIISIQMDNEPEIDESVYLKLTDAILLSVPLSTNDSVNPRIPSDGQFGEIVISENDDARGVLSLSSSAVSTTEPSSAAFLFIIRERGTFGSVSVDFEVLSGSALVADYAPSRGQVTLSERQDRAALPLNIIDDSLAEFDEDFVVRLTGETEGGRLGTVTMATVTILSNDDPNGRFEFSVASRNQLVEEPVSGSTAVTLVVDRRGGLTGVVEVQWRTNSSDVFPLSGSLSFLSSVSQQSFTVNLIADDLPEELEVVEIELHSPTGGAAIGSENTAQISIPANDDPNGIVQFEADNVDINETDSSLKVLRRRGTFGQVRVTYAIEQIDISDLATADGTPPTDYFATIPSTALPNGVVYRSQAATTSNPTMECAELCLSDRACMSFNVNGNTPPTCRLSSSTSSSGVTQTGSMVYDKLVARVRPFEMQQASPSDFTPVASSNIIIDDSNNMGSIPLSINNDSLPEFEEYFVVRILSVQTVALEADSSVMLPVGEPDYVWVRIVPSDDPNGRFFIFTASGEQTRSVPENENFAVSLTVERRGGANGRVEVLWSPEGSTATQNEDFTAPDFSLIFLEGETRKSIILEILSDSLPERDETIILTLVNASGGAAVAEDGGQRVAIVIEANDNAAGIVRLALESRAAVLSEGQEVVLHAERTVGMQGVVEVDWTITGGPNVTKEFMNSSGTAIFEDESSHANITFNVVEDRMPELVELYVLSLTAVRTVSPDVAPSGQAILSDTDTMATITIEASNSPHGIVEFQMGSESVNVSEESSSELTIVREFGTFGDIEVRYRTEGNGSAEVGKDFQGGEFSVIILNGEGSKAIPVPIIDDDIPELEERFNVVLISVKLVNSSNTSSPPFLGARNTVTITIPPNDNPQGELVFQYSNLTVFEEDINMMLLVLREDGRFGRVTVEVILVEMGASGSGVDFTFQETELIFEDEEFEMFIEFSLTDDAMPEDDELFMLRLTNVQGGAVLGDPNEITVTIANSDEAYGIFSYTVDSLNTTLEEAGIVTTEDNIARLSVQRMGGAIREVSVPYQVDTAGRDDISQSSGVIVFPPGVTQQSLVLTAVMDEIPELTETFQVTLMDPVLGRLADSNTVAMVTISSNQDPYGLFEIVPVSSPATPSLRIEENVGVVGLQIKRSFGTFGSVTVDWGTTADTAQDNTGGTTPFLATSQMFPALNESKKWHYFTDATGNEYLLLLSSVAMGTSRLYQWKGTFVLTQTISTFGAQSADSYTFSDNHTVLAIANSEGDSTVYELVDQSLVVLQSLETNVASDVAFFTAPTRSGISGLHLLLSNKGDTVQTNSVIYLWTGSTFVTSQLLSLQSPSAVAIFTANSTLFMVAVSESDDRSPVYSWEDGEFDLKGHFSTSSASDVEYFTSSTGDGYVAVSSPSTDVNIHTFSSTSLIADTLFTSIATVGGTDIEIFYRQGYVNLIVTQSSSSALWYVQQQDGRFSLHPHFTLPQASSAAAFTSGGGVNYVAITTANTDMELLYRETVFTPNMTDYIADGGTMQFDSSESVHTVYVNIVDDRLPELDEFFEIELTNPTGGASIGSRGRTEVVIATNDNAHGVIQIAQMSRSIVIEEDSSDIEVIVTVERLEGTEGIVEVSLELEGDHGTNEVRLSSESVIFPDSITTANVTVFITSDNDPELNELTRLLLHQVLQNGVGSSGDPNRGAIIGSSNVAVITTLANDDPYGVFTWSASTVEVAEPEEEESSSIQLTIIREFGRAGTVEVSYTTGMKTTGAERSRASPNEDYLPSNGTRLMEDGITSVTIAVGIHGDEEPEVGEEFYVNITQVQLANGSVSQNPALNSPRVGNGVVTVVIATNDDGNGVVEFAVEKESDGTVHVNEIEGVLRLGLVRTGGSFGQVSVSWRATESSALGNGVDYETDSGVVTFQDLETTAFIPIPIVNDLEPELEETFTVELVSGNGGVRLGNDVMTTVTILRSDDINGVFQFIGSTVVILAESITPEDPEGLATFTVRRSSGMIGEVEVYWEVGPVAEGDLFPVNGTLVFPENVTLQTLTIRALGDGEAEEFEAFTITLVSATNGGRIFGTSQANLGILASNDPSGVVAFDPYPEGIVVNEGETVNARLHRSGGTFGTALVMWELTPADVNTFQSSTGQVVFEDQQEVADIVIQTLSDSSPEVAAMYNLVLVTAGQARINFDASSIPIFVRASDFPHGIFQFGQPFQIPVEESVGQVGVPVLRNFGSHGTVRVTYTSIEDEAILNEDYTIPYSTLTFNDTTVSANIIVRISDDAIPERAEAFQLQLLAVELLNLPNFGRTFSYNGSSDIDVSPSLGENRVVEVIIDENDDARGVISLSSTIYRVSEGETLSVNVTRSGGTIGTISVDYRLTESSAVGDGVDYQGGSGIQTLVIPPEVSSAIISIPIVNDNDAELQEQFTIQILDADNGATLGDVTMATIIIAASDSPGGLISFGEEELTGIVVDNPTSAEGARLLNLQVIRTVNLNREVSIQWRVTGPDPGMEVQDIDQSTLQGLFVFTNGQSSGRIRVWILPTDDPEPEELFLVSFIAASGGAVFDPAAPARITVTQQGMPFGVIGFAGEALDPRVFVEGEEATSLYFPVSRSEGALGMTEVFFEVISIGDTSVDISPVNGSVVMTTGTIRVNITLNLLPDRIPELEESFQVRLTSASGGATIDNTRTTSAFSVRANNVPYGEFALSQAAVTTTTTPSISRNLNVTILRELGDFGTVRCTISIAYDQAPDASYVASPVAVDFVPEEVEKQVILPISSDAFLSAGGSFTIALESVQLTSSGDSSVPPVIADIGRLVMVTVSDGTANPLVSFAPESLGPPVDLTLVNDNVEFVVVKTGSLGDVVVSWQVGQITPEEGVADGSLLPSSGSIRMAYNQTRADFKLTATPILPHGQREIFLVNLQVSSLVGVASEVDPSFAQSVVEPFGVIRLGVESITEFEGQSAKVRVWRQYGSAGAIRVMGMASSVDESSVPPLSIAAVAGTDFSTSPITVDMLEGETEVNISVPLLNNNQQDSIRLLNFTLTGVTRVPIPLGPLVSPRLGISALSALVTIVDDEGGSGTFRFSRTAPISVSEDGGVNVVIAVQRIGSAVGSVRLQVTTSDTGSDPPATKGVDYEAVDQTLTFENEETEKMINLMILDDSEPELDEHFMLQLINSFGEAVIDSSASSLEVIISQNDDALGVFILSQSVLTLNDNVQSTATVTVLRTGGRLDAVTLEWNIDYTDPGTVEVGLQSVLQSIRGTVQFASGESSRDFQVALISENVPQERLDLTLTLRSVTTGATVASDGDTLQVIVSPCTHPVYQFASPSLFTVTNGDPVQLTIERTRCRFVAGNLILVTNPPPGSVKFGAFSLRPAMRGIDFTSVSRAIQFQEGQSESVVTIDILNDQLSEERAFFVNLTAGISGSIAGSDATVIITPPDRGSMLLSVYLSTLQTLAQDQDLIDQLEDIASSLLAALSPPNTVAATSENVEVIHLVLDYITDTVVSNRLLYTPTLTDTILEIYSVLFESTAFRSFLIQFTPKLQNFVYSQVITAPCPGSDSVRLCVPSATRQDCLINIAVNRSRTVDLLNTEYTFGSRNLIRLPNTNLPTTAECVNVLFMEYTSDAAFLVDQHTLNNYVLTVGVQGVQVIGEEQYLTYRIYAPTNNRIIPQEVDCQYWLTAGNRWQSAADNPLCLPPNSQLQNFDYVECQCALLGNFSAQANISNSFGWHPVGPASCAFVMVIMVLIFLLHLFFYERLTSSLILVMNLFIAIFLLELFALVTMLVSESVPAAGCSALGITLHLTIVAQFSLMAVITVYLWLTFFTKYKKPKPLALFIAFGWAVPILVVIISVVALLPGVGFTIFEAYGITRAITCYVPDWFVAMGVTIIPVAIFLFISALAFLHASIFCSKWGDREGVYNYSFNKRDVVYLVIWYALITTTWIFAALHAYIGIVEVFSFFVAFNILQGIYALLVYGLLGWERLARRYKKRNIPKNTSIALTPPRMGGYKVTSSQHNYGDTLRLVEDEQEPWEKTGETFGRETPEKVVPIAIRPKAPSTHSSNSFESTSDRPMDQDDQEDSHYNDLMFMLRTGGTMDSHSSTHSQPTPSERFELRRISIADTHL